MSRRLLPFVLAAALTACQGAPTAPTGASGPRGTAKPAAGQAPGPGSSPTAAPGLATPPPAVLKPVAASLAGVVRAPVAIIKNAGALIGNDGSTLIGNDGSTLIGNDGSTLIGNDGGTLIGNDGSTLIGNDGSTLIGNDGSTLIGNDGSTYRLQAVAGQAPVQGALVKLLTAAGQPVLANGAAVTATTDAKGAYAFGEVQVPPGAVVVAELGKGATLRAIAPQAAGQRTVDVEIVSTLTTAYILATYVATQADQDGTLAKLTPDAEAATRAAAERILKVGKVAVPADLAPAGLAQAMGKLRKASKELDGKLEIVKSQLIAAGLSDLGAGELGTKVPIDAVYYMAPADGGVWFADDRAHRIWKLRDADRRLETAVGSGVEGQADDAGRPGAEADLAPIEGLAADAAGRLLFGEQLQDGTLRVSRLDADGKLVVLDAPGLAASTPRGGALNGGFLPGDGDAAWVVRQVFEDGRAAGWTIGTLAPGRAYQAVGPLKRPDGDPPQAVRLLARNADGRLLIALDNLGVVAFDPAAPGAPPVLQPDERRVDLDVAGNAYLDRGKEPGDVQLLVRAGDAAPRALWSGAAPLLEDLAWTPFVLAKDGTVYGGEGAAVYRYRDGQRERVAGTENAIAGGRLSLARPGGAAVAADGTRYVADEGSDRIFRIPPGQGAEPFAGSRAERPENLWDGLSEDYADDGKNRRNAFFARPMKIALEPQGSLLVLDDGSLDELDAGEEGTFIGSTRLRRIGTDGKVQTLFVGQDNSHSELAVAPDGKVYVSDLQGVYQIDASREARFTPDALQLSGMACGPDGTLYLFADEALYAWRPGDEDMRPLVEDATWLALDQASVEPAGCLAVDARGRLVVAGLASGRVVRWDPATKAFSAIAGPGTQRFGGTGVDDGLSFPRYPTFAPNGDLYVSDIGHRQIKRIPAADLD